MFKRNGKSITNKHIDRDGKKSIAQETLDIIAQKYYTAPNGNIIDISENLDAAVKNTVLYSEYLPVKEYEKCSTTFEVNNETTGNAVARLMAAGKDNILALNFASAICPGGGFVGGASAQEEDLCRCSGLYACLKSKPAYYNKNILCGDKYYTDDVIYSPNVPFFRKDDLSFLDEPFHLSIISAPAPCRFMMDDFDSKKLAATFLCRIEKILQIAAENGHKNLVLGAWGCGAFGNEPRTVSWAFKENLDRMPFFEHICFAVYDTREPPVLFETFKKEFMK